MKKVPFFVRSFAENIAYNYGQADPVNTCVNSWVNSLGHRKNLLSNHNYCGIAVYVHEGKFYFT